MMIISFLPLFSFLPSSPSLFLAPSLPSLSPFLSFLSFLSFIFSSEGRAAQRPSWDSRLDVGGARLPSGTHGAVWSSFQGSRLTSSPTPIPPMSSLMRRARAHGHLGCPCQWASRTGATGRPASRNPRRVGAAAADSRLWPRAIRG